MRKTLAYLMAVVLVALVFSAVPMSVSAEYVGNVTILADGTVDPADAPIHVKGMKYTMTDDISGRIKIKKSGITLDGAGFTVQGSGSGYGIRLRSVTGITLRNLNVDGFRAGIRGDRTSDNKIMDNRVTNNIKTGIALWYGSCNNHVSGNTVSQNGYGIGMFTNSCDNIVTDNTVSANTDVGIRTEGYSNNNKITNNVITDHGLNGIDIYAHCTGNKISGNTISDNDRDGIAITYGGNNNRISGNTISNSGDDAIHVEESDYNWISENIIDTTGLVGGSEEPLGDIFCDGIYLFDSTGNTISENVITNHLEDGIYLVESNDNTVTENMLFDGDSGVVVEISSSNNLVSENTIDNMALFGVGLYLDCNDNIITDNSITNIAQIAIMVQVECHNNLVTGNTVTNAQGGIWIYYDSSGNVVSENTVTDCAWEGVRLRYSGGNTIYGNLLENNKRGILIWYNPEGDGNMIIGNTIKENSFGTIFSFDTFDNIVYHNNFIKNDVQAIDNGETNSWDDGSEGNYWSDYDGKDKDHDGIGDTPYTGILGAAGSVDNYPLMHKH